MDQILSAFRLVHSDIGFIIIFLSSDSIVRSKDKTKLNTKKGLHVSTFFYKNNCLKWMKFNRSWY